MTTVAVNRTHIAADRQVTKNSVKMRTTSKIVALPIESAQKLFNTDRAYIGYSGLVGQWGAIVSWLLSGANGKPPPSVKMDFLALTSDGRIFLGEGLSQWFELHTDYAAIGSGGEFAMGALSAGSTPIKAVEIASIYDTGTGMGADEYSFS